MQEEQKNDSKQDYRYFLIGIGVFIIGLIIFFIIGSMGWPGTPDPCIAANRYHCETIDYVGFYRQPYNTWTNLLIVIPGFIILLQIGNVKPTNDPKELDNDLLRPSILSITWGMVSILIGLCSMFFHASLTMWGNFLDILSMILLVNFLICFDLSRVLLWSQKQFISVLILITSIFGVLLFYIPEMNELFFTLLVVVVVLLDLSIFIVKKHGKSLEWINRDWRWFFLGLIIWTGVTFVWLASNTGGPLCNPESLFSGHLVWHLGDGLCIYIFYIYARTERRDLKLRDSIKNTIEK